MNWLQLHALQLLAPVLLGLLAKKGVDLLEHLSSWLANADPRVKPIVAGAVSLAVTLLAKATGQALPTECLGDAVAGECLHALADPTVLTALLTWVFAHMINGASNKAKDAR